MKPQTVKTPKNYHLSFEVDNLHILYLCLKKRNYFCLKYRYTLQLIPIVGCLLYVLGSKYRNISFERQLRLNFE